MKSFLALALSICAASTTLADQPHSNDQPIDVPKTGAPFVELTPRIAPQPFVGVTIVFDSITPTNQFVYPGTIRCYTDAGQGQNIGGQNLGQWWRGGWNGPKLEIEERFLRQRVRSLPRGSMWIVDIEHWPHDLRSAGDEVVEESTRKLRRVLAIVRDERPDLCIGAYASIPSDYWSIIHFRMAQLAKARSERGETLSEKEKWALGGFDRFQSDFTSWQRACDRMQFGVRDDGTIERNGGLIDALDVVTPSCYLIYDIDDGPDDPLDIATDRVHLTEMMRQSLRVSGGRPVIPYVMTALTDQGLPADRRAIRPGRLRAAFQTLRDAGAGGVIIWDWTRGRPLNDQQKQAMQIATEVFGKYLPGK